MGLVCYMLSIPSPSAAGLWKRQPCCPQPLADEKPLGLLFLLSFNKEDMKAVPINITSPGPSDCVTTAAQKDNLDCAGGAAPSGREAELPGQLNHSKPKPSQRLYTSSKDTSVALTKQFRVK